jgi:pimeloyl-ACP methyl ester carboxylesterase
VRHCLHVQLATGYGQAGVIVVEPFRIHVADEVLNDLRARLRNARWPDQIPGIGWEQGTELDWLRRLVSYWSHEFDWRGWERRLNAFHHFTWEGIHFVYQRAASGRGVPLILTHGWPSSFLDYMDMLPMLEHFDVVVPSLPGYGFSPRPPRVGINYRYVSQRWHRLMSELGYSRYGASGYDFGAGVTTILALDHPESVIGIHLTTLESDLAPVVDDTELSDVERSYLAVSWNWDTKERGYSAIQSTKPQTVGYGLNDSPAGLAAYVGEKWHSWSDVTPTNDFLCATLTCTGSRRASRRPCATIGTIAGTRSIPATSARPRRLVFSRTRPFPRANCRARIWSAYTTFSAGQSFRAAGTSPRLRNQRRSQGT